jgi:2-polyprenyl-3-methyl-5-hydroxy-6-metoxy-1,4-benzoquinol methylase
VPSIVENSRRWDGTYNWRNRGDEWSQAWGGAEMQWHASILPRIHAFVPTGTILEIAPGYGRWTQYLKDVCNRLIGVDLSQQCVGACRQRFAGCPGLSFHVNDGKSLEMAPDGEIDFAFSFDSLVHAEEDVLAAYVQQLPAKLKPNGVVFVHHSNLGQYRHYFTLLRKVPPLRKLLKKLGGETNAGWRAHSMTAAKLRRFAADAGLLVIGQELINWLSRFYTDCFSILTPPGSIWARPNTVLKNRRFMQETRLISRLAPLYADRRAA